MDFKYLSDEELGKMKPSERKEYMRAKNAYEKAKSMDEIEKAGIESMVAAKESTPLDESTNASPVEATHTETLPEQPKHTEVAVASHETEETGVVAAEKIPTLSFIKKKKETKTRQIGLLVTPTLYNKLDAIAKANQLSMNDMLNQFLEQLVEQ